MIIVLSKASIKSGWVKEEYDQAIGQRTSFRNYRIIPIRIEECDISGDVDCPKGNINTCIEAGIAVGSGVPLYLLARGPRHRPPYMLDDCQIWPYSDNIDLLGTVHKVIYPYRRRIINYELD